MPGLARPAMTAAVVRDTAIALRSEEEHLVFEGVRTQRPAMAEDNGLPRTPIVVINSRAIRGGDRAHGFALRVVGESSWPGCLGVGRANRRSHRQLCAAETNRSCIITPNLGRSCASKTRPPNTFGNSRSAVLTEFAMCFGAPYRPAMRMDSASRDFATPIAGWTGQLNPPPRRCPDGYVAIANRCPLPLRDCGRGWGEAQRTVRGPLPQPPPARGGGV